jgi:hypothetical protein
MNHLPIMTGESSTNCPIADYVIQEPVLLLYVLALLIFFVDYWGFGVSSYK